MAGPRKDKQNAWDDIERELRMFATVVRSLRKSQKLEPNEFRETDVMKAFAFLKEGSRIDVMQIRAILTLLKMVWRLIHW